MKAAVLLPAAVLSVLGAFSQPCYREAFAISGNAPVMSLVSDVAGQLSAAGVRIAASELDSEAAFANLRNGRSDAGLLAIRLGTSAAGLDAHAVATGGLVFVTHPHRNLSGLTSEQVAALYTGQITNWQQLGGPDAEIVLLHANTFVQAQINSHFGLDAERVVPGRACGSDRRCERRIASDSFAIGCMSVTAALRAIAGGTPLKMLSLDGATATNESVEVGSYPLRRTLFAMFPDHVGPIGRQLLDYLAAPEGAQTLRQHGFEPMTRS